MTDNKAYFIIMFVVWLTIVVFVVFILYHYAFEIPLIGYISKPTLFE